MENGEIYGIKWRNLWNLMKYDEGAMCPCRLNGLFGNLEKKNLPLAKMSIFASINRLHNPS